MKNVNSINQLLLSIIIPVYNTEEYLVECLDSVVNIDGLGYEIIIINDGSTDDSFDICKRYANDYPELITLINQTNSGLSASRNEGIKKAVGKYLYFLDSDDFVNSEKLKEVTFSANEYDLDMIIFNGYHFQIDNQGKKKYSIGYKRELLSEKIISGSRMLEKMIKTKSYYASSCLYLVKKSLFVNNNLTFLRGIIHEDEHITPLLLLNSRKTIHKPEPILHRRIRPNSIMTTLDSKKSYFGSYKGLENVLTHERNFLSEKSYRWIVLKFYFKLKIHETENNKSSNNLVHKKELFKKYKIYQFPKLFLKSFILNKTPKIAIKLKNIKNKT